MQVCWTVENNELRKKVVIYKALSPKAIFSRRSSVRSRRVKIWTKEEINERHTLGT